ncbi:MAG TPA: iron ABC transporter permease [Bellilinea sp.]|nr:iron ABC transporter permease [Bellilinea sp.]
MELRHTARPYGFALLALAAAGLLSVLVGSVTLSISDLLEGLRSLGSGVESTAGTILFSLRLPRTILIAMVGAALAGSGTAYQGLFRNPLADPYLIGVASGAGLGAVAAMSIKWSYTTLGLLAVPLAAFASGLITVAIVYALARVGHALPASNLILSGVAVSSFATALTSFLMLRASGELRRALAWLLGGATMSGWQPVLALLPYWLVGLGILMTFGHALNVLQFGDDQAQQLGLPVNRVRRWIIVAASLTTAAAVSFAGIIGFVGLIIPHILRLLIGPDYRRLLPLSLIGGAALLLGADVLARVLLAPQELPVGIVTALAGAPFFLWVLRRSRQANYWS